MCGGVRYTTNKETVRVYFPNPQAKLPILMRDGNISLMPWGRRKEQEGNLPLGGWARLDSINTGKWEYVHPIPVKIIVDGFMEKDHNKDSHWFTLEEGRLFRDWLLTIMMSKEFMLLLLSLIH